MPRLFAQSSRLEGFGNTIFSEMSELAAATGSINLGQGFPDLDGPSELKQVAIEAITNGPNQYPPGAGMPVLRQAVREHQQRYYGLCYDEDEILVTVGATEGIAAAMLGLLNEGDEVVMFEPYYDSYAASVAMAGATRRVVTLSYPDWSFDEAEFDAAINDRTRLVLLNSPHNPTGKVFSVEELSFIARRCVEHDLLAVTDEVYEHLVFSETHLPLATFPAMRDRTLSISSGGKTFSFTGWKVGWVCGPEPLVSAVRTAKQFLTFVHAPALQIAIAHGLNAGDRLIAPVAISLLEQRDLFVGGLRNLGFTVSEPAGTYFATTDVAFLGHDDALRFCRELPGLCGVVGVPVSVFYDHHDLGRSLVRFAFCKQKEVLEEALSRLKLLFS